MAKSDQCAAIGTEGEQIAKRYLQKLGYKIYHSNIRVHRDEIDIIAYDPADRVIVFTEVKARSQHVQDFGPELNMTDGKIKKLLRSARAWVHEHNFAGGYRVDVVFVVAGCVVDHWKELEFTID